MSTTTIPAQARATLETTRSARDFTRSELQRISAALKYEASTVEAARGMFQDVAEAHVLGEADKASFDAVRAELRQREKHNETAESAAASLATLSEDNP